MDGSLPVGKSNDALDGEVGLGRVLLRAKRRGQVDFLFNRLLEPRETSKKLAVEICEGVLEKPQPQTEGKQ